MHRRILFAQVKKAMMLRLLVVALMLCAVLGTGIRWWFIHGDAYRYMWVEIPTMKTEAALVKGLSIVKIDDVSTSGEVDVYVTFQVEGKGMLTLNNPTRMNFIGQIIPQIAGMNDCEVVVAADPRWDFEYKTVQDVIQDFDNIYAKFRHEGYCSDDYHESILPKLK